MDKGKVYRQLLDKNREKICKTIECYKFLTILREKQIFDQSDEEEVIGYAKNSVQRNSHMLDLLMKRSAQGMIIFLEKIGLEYPDLYKELTGREPPPKSPQEPQSASRLSLRLLSDMGKVISKFTEGFVVQKLEVEELKKGIADLEKNNVKMIQAINDLTNKIEKLEKENFYLKITVNNDIYSQPNKRHGIFDTENSNTTNELKFIENENTNDENCSNSNHHSNSRMRRKPAIKWKGRSEEAADFRNDDYEEIVSLNRYASNT